MPASWKVSCLRIALSTFFTLTACTELLHKQTTPDAQEGAPSSEPASDEDASMRVTVTAGSSRINSCSSCSHIKSHPESPALSVSHAGTGAALSVNKQGSGAAVLIRGGRVELSEDGGVIVMASVTQVAAGERIKVGSGASIVTVQAAAGKQSNALIITKGREGQLLWLHNADDDPCHLIDDEHAVIAAGAVRQLLFLGATWRFVG